MLPVVPPLSPCPLVPCPPPCHHRHSDLRYGAGLGIHGTEERMPHPVLRPERGVVVFPGPFFVTDEHHSDGILLPRRVIRSASRRFMDNSGVEFGTESRP